MPNLIYSAIGSVDGYTVDADGSFTWAAPDEEVHAFVNDLTRPIGTMMLGRGMYDVMGIWETLDVSGEPAEMRDFQSIWLGMDKVVYSRTLDEPTTARTRIEREFAVDEVARLKASADHDVAIGGPTLAALALQAGLVDELQLFLTPHVIGGGTRALSDGVRFAVDLLEERRFAGGTVFLRYAVKA